MSFDNELIYNSPWPPRIIYKPQPMDTTMNRALEQTESARQIVLFRAKSGLIRTTIIQ
jgi:hypothetical protein